MSHSKHKKHSGTEKHNHQPYLKRAHRDWKTYVIVGLMLAAMAIYVVTLDESFVPREPAKPAVAGEMAR